MKQSKTHIIVYNAVFTVISLVLGFLGRLSVFPVFPFLKLDFSDIPVFLAALISGASSGVLVLFTASILRTLMFSSSGWIGFIIRLTSVIMILFIGIFKKEKSRKFKMIFGISLGFIFCLIVKLWLNYFFWINFFAVSRELLSALMISVIVPYNVLKLLITVSAAFALEKPIKNIFERFR